jgi:hypothetical protein
MIKAIHQLDDLEKKIILLLYENPEGFTTSQLQTLTGCTRQYLHDLCYSVFYNDRIEGIPQYFKAFYVTEDKGNFREWRYTLTEAGRLLAEALGNKIGKPLKIP